VGIPLLIGGAANSELKEASQIESRFLHPLPDKCQLSRAVGTYKEPNAGGYAKKKRQHHHDKQRVEYSF
jgi:hypothetical protein